MWTLLLSLLTLSLAEYTQTDYWAGKTFYDNFNFFSGNDPTNGYVDFTTRQQAFDWALVDPGYPSYMGADHVTVSSGRGRASVRINSQQSWTVQPGSSTYLFALDLTHVPTGCGTWPAWWFVGPNWPNSGEIDVIEGIHVNVNDQSTLHTSAGCSLQSGNHGTGTPTGHPSCVSSGKDNAGCGIVGGYGSFGVPFNQNQGGVYAMEWNHEQINVWFFPRGKIPSDLNPGATHANPQNWGEPQAFWTFGSNCSPTHFRDVQMVFDLTFCGDWAGPTFGADCPGKGSCDTFVKNNPTAFDEAYWLINFVKVWEQ